MSTPEHLLSDFFTPDELADELQICEATLARWERLGEGPPRTCVGRKIYFNRASVLAWLRAREQQRSARHG
jgi:hypothetical protein